MMKRRTRWKVLMGFLLAVHCLTHPISAKGEEEPVAESPRLDIILVLDNSGSMKANDPGMMTKNVVTEFVGWLPKDSRIGFVIFADRADLAMPLTLVAKENIRENVEEILKQIDYQGRYTDTSAAIERAIYELKIGGRKDANKCVLFLTDGILDTGDEENDFEKRNWMKNELAQESKNAGIKIFGIAFTDQADFELIQTLGHKTEGGYYRAQNIEDIEKIFANINEIILKTRSEPEIDPELRQEVKIEQRSTNVLPPPLAPPSLEKEISGKLTILVWVMGLSCIALVVAMGYLIRWKKYDGKIIRTEETVESIPVAFLEDIQGVTSQTTHQIATKTTRIGRARQGNGDHQASPPDINIPQPTVSALHATIEYRDQGFYLVDQRSTNYTYLNGQKIAEEVRLKGGDEIAFDRYTFRFVLPDQEAKGGTIISPQPGGAYRKEWEATQAPLASSMQGPLVEDVLWMDLGEGEPPAAPPKGPESSAKITVQPGSCPNHPRYKATELCPDCQQKYCVYCMKEHEGRQICSHCAGWF